MISRFLNAAVLILISTVSVRVQANCIQLAQAAVDTCQSKEALETADQATKKINSDFKPKNDRMSNQSCTGFQEAYDQYDQLTNQYIQACHQMVNEQLGQCVVETQVSSLGDMENMKKALELQNKAAAEIPKLQNIRKDLPVLKAKLDDCLRDSKGKDVKNENRDRGNADTKGTPGNNQGQGANSGQGSDQSGQGQGSGSGSGGGAPKLPEIPKNEKEKKAQTPDGSTGVQTVGGIVIPGQNAGVGQGMTAAKPATLNSPLATLVNHQKRLRDSVMRRPASHPSGVQGVSGPHTDMFNNVKTRYRDLRTNGDFL